MFLSFLRFLSITIERLRLVAYKPRNLLTEKEWWKIRIFGLRMAALDPKIWGILVSDRTDNRQLVPMRPYYLRASEDKSFRIEEISFKFKFQFANPGSLERSAHVKESILEIGFSEIISNVSSKGKALRLSAFPAVKTGLYERSESTYKSVELAKENLLTGTDYKIHLQFKDNRLDVSLNDLPYLRLESSGLKEGMISLRSGWNPASIHDLQIKGRVNNEENFEASGIVEVNKKPASKKQTDNSVLP